MNSIKGAGTSLRINCGQGSSDRSRGALLRVLDRSRCFGWSITYGAEAPISFKEMGTTTRTRMISLDDFYIAGEFARLELFGKRYSSIHPLWRVYSFAARTRVNPFAGM